MLAENPMREGRVFIIHTIKPKCLIEVCEPQDNPKSSGYPHGIYEYFNTGRIKETWALIVRDVYDNPDLADVQNLLDKAWKWYKSYLKFEDKNIDDTNRDNYLGTVN